jgi:hypothetical protein
VEVSGLGDRRHDEFVSVPIAGFVSNVLCDRHNPALSPLDCIGQRFFRSLRALNSALRDKTKNPKDRAYLFNGHDIERYILKALCGDGFANKLDTLRGRKRGWRPSDQWVRILYGLEPFQDGWGLYLTADIGGTIDLDENVLGIRPIANDADELCGATFKVLGLEFELLMTIPNPAQERYAGNCRYRPAEVIFSDGRATQAILFGWDIKGQGGSLHIQHGVSVSPQSRPSENAKGLD